MDKQAVEQQLCLAAFGEDMADRLAALEQRIYEAAGTKFNINSPKQLGVILFDKLGLPARSRHGRGLPEPGAVISGRTGLYLAG